MNYERDSVNVPARRYVRSMKGLVIMRAVVGCATMIIGLQGQAQTTSSVTGTVVDANTRAPIRSSTVFIQLMDTVLTTTTDEGGRYTFTDIPTGIHTVRAQGSGHDVGTAPEVWVRTGRTEVVDLELAPRANDLGEVMVEGRAPRMSTTMSAHELTVERSLRYPATFFDPARLVASFAGVATTNDQANHFSVRGNGPASNAWLLEGAEIVTPNHLTNAGTQSDFPTLSGGGTTILSAQVLGNSRLLVGGLTAPYGNAVGGIMDVHLRPGSTERRAFTGQAGLLGIDLSTEGPFRIGGKATYLLNYRYSTLGLLSELGVALGDEVITFQDLSFNVHLPLGERSTIAVFGMGGTSSNTFEAKDSTEWEFDKDSQNIDYTGQVGVAGVSYEQRIGDRTTLYAVAVISANDQERIEEGLFFRRGGRTTISHSLEERKLSLLTRVRTAITGRSVLHIGFGAMERTIDKDFDLPEVVQGWLVRPYAQGEFRFGDRWRMEMGAAYAHSTADGSSAIEPRMGLGLTVGADRSLTLSVGQRSQLPAVQFFPVRTTSDLLQNASVGLTRSRDLNLAYDHPIRPHLIFHAEFFHQRILDVPVADTTGVLFGQASAMSLVNVWDAPVVMDLVNKGDALNRGVEVGLQHRSHNRVFYQANITFFDAAFTDAYGDRYNARWNTGLIGNVVVGKEFPKQKENAKRTWGMTARLNGMGGQRIPSAYYTNGRPWSEQYDPFYRLDLRVYRKMEHQGRTGMWALDLQNVTNAQNEAYRYYDLRKGEVVTKYQLGLIPNLSYRIEF